MKNVIMLTHRLYPYNAGDALYNLGLVKAIDKHCRLTVYSLLKDTYDINTLPVDRVTIKYYSCYDDHFDTPSQAMVNDIIEQSRREKIDIIIINHILMAPYFKLLKKKVPQAEYGYVSHDAEAVNRLERYKYRISKKKLIFPMNVARCIRNIFLQKQYERIEKTLLTKSDFYFSISKHDMEIHKQMYGSVCKSYFCKPLIEFPRVKSIEDLKEFRKRIVIVGTMQWYPNVIGVTWFINNVMRYLADEQWVLYVVGADPASEIIETAALYPDNIIVTGRVESIQEYLQKCDISLIPIFDGTGAKIKVLESIAAGIPTVSTSFAAKDYDINDEMLIADTPEEFVNSLHMIENNVDLRLRLLERSEEYIRNYMKLNPEIIKLLEEK